MLKERITDTFIGRLQALTVLDEQFLLIRQNAVRNFKKANLNLIVKRLGSNALLLTLWLRTVKRSQSF